jgi:hypothetical protein
VRATASKGTTGRVTARKPVTSRPAFWITAVTVFVVIAFLAVSITDNSLFNNTPADQKSPATTLLQKPVLPGGEDTASTTGGVQARCKDGTYYFSGNRDTPDKDLCKDNGGVEKRL